MVSIQKIYDDAENLYEQGNYEEALKLFASIMDDYETYSAACYYGCCLTRLGEYDKSIALFKKLLDLCPDWESLWYNLGDAYLKNGDKEQALSCLLKAEEIAPEHPNTCFYLGLYYEKAEDYEKAISYYKRSLKADNCFETNANLAVCYYAVEEFEKSLTYASKSYRLYPDLDNLYNYTRVLVKLKKYEEALEVFKATDLDYNEDAGILISHIICLLRTGDFQQADEMYVKLKKVDNVSTMACDYQEIKKKHIEKYNEKKCLMESNDK